MNSPDFWLICIILFSLSTRETVPDPSQTPNLNGSDPDMLLPFVQAAHENVRSQICDFFLVSGLAV